ncbi:MAG TPA: glycosyltransferase family 2 protein, partial [Candidatus Saccharibacteria bacterium]|nr:glycosyltransferase family 2 protein [Candidatus Saccharibacteria bacterium]
MKKPILSVIIPVYNAGADIRSVIKDVLSQSFKDFELILVDDGSMDNTLSVLRGIQSKDKRVVVLSKKNGGPSSARNAGLKRAKGTYIQFFDADDRVPKGALEAVVSSMENTGSDMVVSGWQIDLWVKDRLVRNHKTIALKEEEISGDTATIKKHVLKSIGSDGRLYNLWNKMFRADIIKDNYLLFNENIRFGEDVIFAFEYLRHVSKINYIPTVTYHYQA